MHGKCQAKTVRYVKLLKEGRSSACSKTHPMARQNDTELLEKLAARWRERVVGFTPTDASRESVGLVS